ncbi:MAG: flagellar hook-length control protein FliK [Pyrinomonadaceae bacterium]|nr:flagellar hook-length control protein FliK [Pyrinomonadaceae bacterium]
MISFTTFDNFEKQPPPVTDNEPKAEDFAAFLNAPVAPSNFQPPQNNEASESPEMMPGVESAESAPIVFANFKTDSRLNTADFSQKTKTVQTPLSDNFFPPQTDGILDPNRSKKAENFFNLPKPVLTTRQTIILPPSIESSPLPANLPTDQSIYNDLEIHLVISKDGLDNDFDASVRLSELSAGSPFTELVKPEFSRQKTFSPKPSEMRFFNVKTSESTAETKVFTQLPNKEIVDLKLSEKTLPEIKPDVRVFDVKSPESKDSKLAPGAESIAVKSSETKVSESIPSPPLKISKIKSPESNDFKILPNVKTSDVKTPSTKNPEIKSSAETFEIKKTEIKLPQAKATVETLGAKLTETEVANIEKTPEITESDFAFNFDKFLTAVTKQSKAIESALKHPLESQKIFAQVEPRLLQIVSMMTDENEKKVMKMRLHPAELGTIEVRLEKNSAGILIAHFQTETEAVRQSLAQNIEQLRDSLQNSGWQVEQLNVTCQKFSPGDGEQPANHSQPNEPVEYPPAAETNIDRNSNNQNDLKQNQPSRLLSVRA